MKFSLKRLKIPAADAVPAQAGISVFHHPNRLQKKYFFTGWSKTFRCKAREIRRNEAYFSVRRNDEG